MQGAIFTALEDMVIEKMGLEVWDELIQTTKPASGASYTSGEQYDDGELVNFVVALSEKSGIEVPDLLDAFGQYLFAILYENSPVDLKHITSLKDYLLMIDGVIHKEVQRLHPNAYLPKFDYDASDDSKLIMYYSSKTKLCHASVGLIKGAADQFKEEITIDHPECMHEGAERCKLVINFH